MRHAAGELAQRIHLLRLAELFLEPAPLGRIMRADDDAAGIALLARNRRRHRLDNLARMDPLVAIRAAAVEAGAKIAVHLRAGDGAERLDRRSPRQLVRLAAVKAGQRRIDLLKAEALALLHQHGVVFRRVLEERPDERLARGELGRPLGDPALERVVDPRQLLLGPLRVGDVVRHADIADVLAGEAPARLRLRLHPAPLAVRAAEARLDLDRLRRPVDGRGGGANARQVFRMQGVAPVDGERFLVGSAEEVEIGLIDELAPVVRPGHPDEHRRAVGDGAEARLAFGDRALGDLALGDVADDHVDADHAPARVAVGHVHDLGEGDAARARELDLVADVLAGERPFEPVAARSVHLGRHDLVDPPPDDLASRPFEPDLVGPVDEPEHKVAVDVGDEDRKRVGDRAQAFGAVERLLFGALAVGDVDVRADQRDRLARSVALDLRHRPDPALRAVVRPDDPVLGNVGRAAFGERPQEAVDCLLPVVRVDARHPGVVRLDGGVGGKAMDALIFGRAAARERAGAGVDAHASDAADLLDPAKLGLAPFEPAQHGSAFGRVAKRHADALAERKGADLVPAVGRKRRRGFERLLLAVVHDLAVAPLELAPPDCRRDVPEEPADHGLALAAEDLLGGAIEGGEAEVAVEGEEALAHAVEKLLHDEAALGRQSRQERSRNIRLLPRRATRGHDHEIAHPVVKTRALVAQIAD